jgi:hypothetical protein
MLRIERIRKSERVMKAVIGMTTKEFETLSYSFANAFAKSKRPKKDRKRKEGAGLKHTLKGIEDKLFFVLFYMKCYPTFDVAGFFYGVDKAQISRWIGVLVSVLEIALGYEMVLPERKIRSVKEFLQKFPEIRDVFIDGTERPIRRPSDHKNQKKHYSGKKKRHTRKNIITSDEKRRILVVTPTKSGKTHDKRLTDKFESFEHLPPEVTAWTDTGFQGADKIHSNTMMPKKKPKGRELTDKEREENKIIAQIRILSENAIAGIKRYACVSHVYRNRPGILDDAFILLSAGLWNYHLKLSSC